MTINRQTLFNKFLRSNSGTDFKRFIHSFRDDDPIEFLDRLNIEYKMTDDNSAVFFLLKVKNSYITFKLSGLNDYSQTLKYVMTNTPLQDVSSINDTSNNVFLYSSRVGGMYSFIDTIMRACATRYDDSYVKNKLHVGLLLFTSEYSTKGMRDTL